MFNIQILNKMKSKKFFKFLGIISICMLLYLFYSSILCRLDVNSDDCVIILRAKDVLSGNIFLKNWYGATVNGIFSWLPPSILGILISGFNIASLDYSNAIAITINFILILKLVYNDNKSYLNVLITICMFLLPVHFTLRYYYRFGSFGHLELITYILLIMILLQSIYAKKVTKNYLFSFYILMIMANITDEMCYYIFTVPLIIVSLIRYFIDKNNLNLKISIVSFIILILSKIINTVLSLNGIYQYNGTGEKYICHFEDICHNILITLRSFIAFSNANFFGDKIFSLITVSKIIGAILLIVGIFILFYNIKIFFSNGIVNQILFLSIVFQIIAFTFSNLCDFAAHRYLFPPYIFLLILMCRFDWNKYLINLETNLEKLNFKFSLNNIKTIFMLFFIFIPICRILTIPEKTTEIRPYQKVSNFLCERNLTSGYAPYWSSHVVTLSSEGKVQVSNVTSDQININQMRWFSNSEWYKKPANFIILHDDDGIYTIYLSRDVVSKVLGKPKEIHNIDNYSILIYDYDISKRVNSDYNVFNFGSQLGYNSEISNCIDKKLMLNPNDIQFGPHAHLNKGKYTVTILGDNLDNGTFDICSDKANKILELENLNITPTKVTYDVKLDKNVNDIEFRCHNNSNDAIVIKSLNATYKK